MATEVLAIPTPPTLTNGYDGGANYNLGIRFSLVAPQSCAGVSWLRTPDAPIHTPSGGAWVATLWNWDTQAILDSATFTPGAAIQQDIPFASSVPLVNGVNYAVTVYTQDYTFRANGGNVDTFTPSNNTVGDIGLLSTTGGPTGFPGTTQSAWYYVSPLMVTGDPAEGTSDVGLGLAVAATGGADAEGAAALGIGLAVAATGGADAEGQGALGLGLAVAASGSVRAQGAVTLTLGLAPAAIGERASLGAAAVGLGLAVVAIGERAASGSAALGLNLAMAANGADGRAGCPVAPWPWTPRVASGFPWTARPVKSFPEGECS